MPSFRSAHSKRSLGAFDAGEATKPLKKPKESRFTQQNLQAWRPVLTPAWVTFVFFSVGLVLIPIGSLCLLASNSVIEHTMRYDDQRQCTSDAETNAEREQLLYERKGEGLLCNITFKVEDTMKAPVFLYYELEDFYQNHRRYVKSRSDEQLHGENPSASSLEDCEPILFLNGSREDVINPCGLSAWSFFNDTYKVYHLTEPGSTSSILDVRETGIAWRSDLDHRFASFRPQNFNEVPSLRGGGDLNGQNVSENEHFVVWMRNSATPRFRKLWGVIEQDLAEGSYVAVEVTNRYNTYRFDGQKAVVLSTASWLGGKNHFLGYVYIITGAVSSVAGTLFFALHIRFPRRMGDERYLSWRRTW